MLRDLLRKNRFWVSRKVYDEYVEKAKRENKLLNENRLKLGNKSRELQIENIDLRKEISELKKVKDEGKTYLLRRCQKCRKYFTVEKGSRRKYCLDCKNNKKKEN